MKTVKDNHVSEIVIQKSRFIGILRPLSSKDQVKEIISKIQKEYPKATHYCYGYIVQGIQKSNDDGEPSGTAGRPILETMIKRDLFDCIIVVVRYFGGIKLGAGGLLRAYVDSACEVLNNAKLFQEEDRFIYDISVGYDNNEILKNYFNSKDIEIIETKYEDMVIYTIASKDLIEDKIKDFMQGKVIVSFVNKETILVAC